MGQHKPNCFEKTKVRWGIFKIFSTLNYNRSTELGMFYSPCYVSGLRSGMKARYSTNKALFVMLKDGLNDSKLAPNGIRVYVVRVSQHI